VSEADCCIAGGGPAGMFLGLLLARQGVEVTVLEKHGDFLRDFRGDTVHPSTLCLLDELGLADQFLELPHQKVTQVAVTTDDGTYVVADFRRLSGRFPFLAFVPQWDFLDFIADQARGYPNFQLRMNAEAIGLLRDDKQVTGVRYRLAGDGEHEVRARLTVAADGRNSELRASAGLRLREFGAPMDVLWFRLSKPPDGSWPFFGGAGRITRGRMLVRLDRGDYWQCAYLVPKGGYEALKEAGLEAFRADLARLLPDGATLETLRGWDDVRVLSVRVDRLTRWHQPGLLFIGDAAHAMSPIGGVGINLAVQDAAAAARILAGPLRAGDVPSRRLARVRRRRLLPTAVTQLVQRQIQTRVLSRILAGDQPIGTPRVLRLVDRHTVLQGWPARAIGIGVLPEHAPPVVSADSRVTTTAVPGDARPRAPGTGESPPARPGR
jgi:2-polyprenyl-6-methoxyphenol hydroxylase-like FAD-dependent oxidoreductase